ncbi:MAG: vesicle-associated membrane protein 4 [Terrestrivirus sp.]|jgi:vesicle-associated membrane protein 4|uniref:Vesicle-associated membrane protein 4 n=1 Tax=Terrestrivirus sp. TaxID=2487775 RepID=A0A3G4ZND7_9VIRU|nr:MAG: vesicle-associated membrane protein 4 [Terrestrivirus sp.]
MDPSKQPTEKTKLQLIQAQVNDVISIVQENISKTIDRGDELQELQGRTEDLEASADRFKHGARDVRKRMCWNNIKMNFLIAFIAIMILLVIIVGAVCGSGLCIPHGSNPPIEPTSVPTVTPTPKF